MEYIKEHKTDIARTVIILIFFGLAILALYLSFAYESDQWVIKDAQAGRFLAHTLINIAPELAGIVIGVVTIDYLNEKRQEGQLKRQLIYQMGSLNTDVTDTAVKVMESYGWLEDGTLKEAVLGGANLSGAYLVRADLRDAVLHGADLRGAYLGGANLSRAILVRADLRDAVLHGADLSGANLYYSNLSGADLEGADLSRAKLEGANLSGANLYYSNLSGADLSGADLEGADLKAARYWIREQLLEANSLKEATMPDGRKYEEWIREPEAENSEEEE